MFKMKKILLAAALGGAAVATPAQADVFTYTMTNGGVLAINNLTNSATYKASDLDVSMTSADFAKFTGGAAPTFTAVLSSLDGLRLISGKWVTDNPLYSTTTHPQKLIMSGTSVNLWAWWGDPIIGGDYVKTITSYTRTSTSGGTPVPEPGVFGLFAVAFGWLAFGRRRKTAGKAAQGKLALA